MGGNWGVFENWVVSPLIESFPEEEEQVAGRSNEAVHLIFQYALVVKPIRMLE